MLVLKNIVKNYTIGDTTVEALKGIDLEFRKSEFVSILGPSGCGKTTLLNIIGGLDRYTSGDLTVNRISTKEFRDDDWDAYRNRSIGFVFQSYNLIPHQTVLANVELAMTLSGVSKAERKKRAVEALTRVGLGDQIHKKPNQISGGQMQRVAIARSLVNDPEILLADEPTGAIDSETSTQIMNILKEIAADRLVIMVTHNPELAEQYSTRIIRLLDGRVVDDSNPYRANIVEPIPKAKKEKGPKKKKPMSFVTALSLSMNNLLTKKTRTFLTAFAGSIGIIGIALILSLSNGVQSYISKVEEDTLSSYPITIQQATMDIGGMMSAAAEMRQNAQAHDKDRVYSTAIMSKMVSTMMSEVKKNDLKAFKAFIESPESGVAGLANGVQYSYSTPMYIYAADTSNGAIQLNPSTLMDTMSGGMGSTMASSFSGLSGMSSMDIWTEMMDNKDVIASQYAVIAGRMPDAYNEVVLIVDEDNEITDMTLYALGLKDPRKVSDMMRDIMAGKEMPDEQTSYSFDEILSLTYKLVLPTDYYEKTDGVWVDRSGDEAYIKAVLDDAIELKIVGILQPSGDSLAVSTNGSIGYMAGLTQRVIQAVGDSEIVKEQLTDPEIDVFTGLAFGVAPGPAAIKMPDLSMLPEQQQKMLAGLSEEQLAEMMEKYAASMPGMQAMMGITEEPETPANTYEDNIALFGVVSEDSPSGINIYPKDFSAKDQLTQIIRDYNRRMRDEGHEELAIRYTDYVGLMMSSVSTIINTISYVLIAFVAISLIVSSIMIGIITYISVLERTKEIGILRSIGASKQDIARVFNAETIIVGFVSGAIGIGVTLLLCLPINALIFSLSGIETVAALPIAGGAILVGISMVLTFIAGLIPSRIAAKKDPVVALRTE